MNVRAFIIPADGEPHVDDLPTGYDMITKMQAIVGGYVEAIALPFGILWVNEDPAMSQVPLGTNAVATRLVRVHSPHTLVSPIGIVGGAVLTGPATSSGATKDVSLAGEAAVHALLTS